MLRYRVSGISEDLAQTVRSKLYSPQYGHPAPGPVFIHREACRQYDELCFPEELRAIPLVLESYGERGMLLNQQRVGERTVEDVIEEQLAEPRVEYLHVRNAEAGCFIARVQPVFACD